MRAQERSHGRRALIMILLIEPPRVNLNIREPLPQGGEIRTVTVDQERSEMICWGYEMYATGHYSIADVTTLLEARGLRTRPTPCHPSKPLSQSQVHALLSNRYYLGEVKYHGK
jgi:site-specific DNA recombinase